ncbi:3-hydroxyacyl-CoA dehydrogenase NAD-binding domain-containing protein [Afifella marina]|uniref:enoyl-CoA hydratase n=2 Tax=Hyphomicrobiales TaxID=356 RepID=A0A1G5M5Z2_AFIMA|nr:3-hydroxyacyl-CoA dehydrogenase NAD-binding domain-containing protein [Afifella marina]MBK1623026.1 3-hydroxyacyl-CoA dehydrogenase [Afifella marina DSM 2698]MBK1626020.1 3-hydroxyacyl-CoA dehydrogenase [Afifella marina]MBK5917844.1 3-hydroxyacyl-CoA dehydrogenase [Afifella marina]RAI18218.1 3-hydroxyacyl-CoA dehydrogenase [Afifella marina DSM 2698]SCZ19789.1 3-hydroxyacyl-CoA dehydrogenase / enoyl-CoA hydratase / 3-hydroxybutyryl-CoA epimerase [Afifella marina DSM 2698]
MTYENFTCETGGDGIALVTWDMPNRSMNVFTETVMEELSAIVEWAVAEDAVKGVVITSAKKDFTGGADINMLSDLLGAFEAKKAENPQAATAELLERASRMSRLYRRIETCGKPFIAAVAGTCMGGGTELALACHGRVVAENAKIGLPEVKIGIFPGAGGTQRVMRMADAVAGLQFLLRGNTLKAEAAKSMGLVEKVAPESELVEAAKAMLSAGVSPVKPWDQEGYKPRGATAVWTPGGFQFWPAANGLYRKETQNNYPGARAIMQAVFEGVQLPMDLALQVESRYFAKTLQTKEAQAMMRSLFVSLQALNKGARRPAGVPASDLKRVGVLGAGFMGAGIAYVTARAGMGVVLIDRDQETAEKGKLHCAGLLEKEVARGRMSEEAAVGILERIVATPDYGALAEADLVIEAVFEDRKVKAEVTEKVKAHLPEGAIFASNTSTLPITSLAKNWRSEADFVGIHFFSPVDKMQLVEVILGEKTEDKALAVALDYVRAIRKTPIVVNDSRGFYANRCVTAYLLEGHLMLLEGVPPAMVENAGKMAGMPVGPLSLTDEVGVDLAWKIVKATEADLGEGAVSAEQKRLLSEMVESRERFGRKNGKGFYDYAGKEKHLWSGLSEIVTPKSADDFDFAELKDRLLVTQALEAARTVEEGVIEDPREADLGSILGFGFAPFTGGTLSYIDFMGLQEFVAKAERLAATYGPRFKPNALLKEMAEKGETFYGRFGTADTSEKAA